MAEACARHMQAQKDLEALQHKMAAAIEDENFEVAGRIKKERVAVRAQMASEEAQQVRSHTHFLMQATQIPTHTHTHARAHTHAHTWIY